MDQPCALLGDSSPCHIPPVIGKPEESPTALDALQSVSGSSWYQNTSPGLQSSDSSSSDIAIQSRDQNNILSHTTVSLCYMSRFSRNGVSQHSPYNIPPASKLSLHSHCASESHSRTSDYSQEQVKETKHLPTQKERLLLQGQAGQAWRGGVCVTQRHLDLNGDGFKEESDVEKQWPLLTDCKLGKGEPNSLVFSEGRLSAVTVSSVTTQKGENRGSDRLLYMVASESTDAPNLCTDYRSPLEDPVSPTSTSLDGVGDVFVLPQASSSPSANTSHPETAKGGAYDAWSTGISDDTTGLDSSENEQCGLDVSENHQNNVVPHVNGKNDEKRLKQRKLPVGSGRAVQLDSVAMNLKSSASKISGCTVINQTNCTSHSTIFNSTLSSPKPKRVPPIYKSNSKSSLKRQAAQIKRGRSGDVVSTSDSEFNETKASNSSTTGKPLLVRMAQKKPILPLRTGIVQCRRKALPQSKRAPQPLSPPGVSAEVTVPSLSLPLPESSKNQDKTKSMEAPSASKKKVSHTPKQRRKRTKRSTPSSMFSPKEPEIKLKYVSYKREKRDSKVDWFSPFIRVEQKRSLPSLCSVVNYPQEVKARQKMQLQTSTCGFVSAVMPSTSCLHVGRPSINSQHQQAFICCLCGQPANAMDLGDLHGPYYPEGLKRSFKTATSITGLKDEEDFSDSDSSSVCIIASRRKSVAPHTVWSVRNQLKQNMEHRRRATNGTISLGAKRARSVNGSLDSQDWFSPPILPLEPREYWLHEDCAIWSAGVFLVKGRVYGLEEAVILAHETMCSGCLRSGATLGCIFKGCPNKYHYRCALEADCALIEENFSMKCKKHKNKTLQAPAGSQLNGR